MVSFFKSGYWVSDFSVRDFLKACSQEKGDEGSRRGQGTDLSNMGPQLVSSHWQLLSFNCTTGLTTSSDKEVGNFTFSYWLWDAKISGIGNKWKSAVYTHRIAKWIYSFASRNLRQKTTCVDDSLIYPENQMTENYRIVSFYYVTISVFIRYILRLRKFFFKNNIPDHMIQQ